MNKLTAYIIAIIGLVVIVFSSTLSKMPFLSNINNILMYLIGAGVVIAGIGIALSLTGKSGSKIPHVSEEVPIYVGEGKERKIVGYRKAK